MFHIIYVVYFVGHDSRIWYVKFVFWAMAFNEYIIVSSVGFINIYSLYCLIPSIIPYLIFILYKSRMELRKLFLHIQDQYKKRQ